MHLFYKLSIRTTTEISVGHFTKNIVIATLNSVCDSQMLRFIFAYNSLCNSYRTKSFLM